MLAPGAALGPQEGSGEELVGGPGLDFWGRVAGVGSSCPRSPSAHELLALLSSWGAEGVGGPRLFCEFLRVSKVYAEGCAGEEQQGSPLWVGA